MNELTSSFDDHVLRVVKVQFIFIFVFHVKVGGNAADAGGG